MNGLTRRRVKLAVRDSSAGAHPLHFPRTNHRTVAETVLVFECAFQHIAYDFHVLMTVAREPFARLDPILVDNAQLAKAHVLAVVILCEGKRVATIQPIEPGNSAGLRLSYRDHLGLLAFFDARVTGPNSLN